MTLATAIEADITAVVAKAAAFEAQIPAAIQLIESEIESFFNWLAGETPAITVAVQTAIGLVNQVQAAGVTIPPALHTDIAALNTAVAGLNAAAAATNAGASPAASVIAGYVAIKNVSGATSDVSTAALQAAAATKPTT